MTDRNALLKVLDAIEDIETRHIVWGLPDESWTHNALMAAIGRVPEAAAFDPESVLDDLLAHQLIFALPHSGYPLRYRSRMAESVRLFAHLRQLFPGRAWQTAPRLVADYRFRHGPRRFPPRNIAPEQVVAELKQAGLKPDQVEAATGVIGGRNLSRFQLDAAVEVYNAMTARDRGVVVSAGTSSGKTLAFYLPALTFLATRSVRAGAGVVAIYPRNELLKDQLATAIDEIKRMRSAGSRPIRIGAFFGGTWRDAQHAARDDGVCNYLTCRNVINGAACEGKLQWLKAHRTRNDETLTCLSCSATLGPDQIVLTRQSMQNNPPDLLFTTTEMLNRSLSNGWSMHIFGVGPRAASRPQMVLLDEVHTYEATSGAQVGYLLRRWRHLLGKPATWVGLSATLTNADQFFADLCGLNEGSVTEVKPSVHELEAKGREYQIVLRGDPDPQVSLLSTTIQSVMLLRRVLDHTPQRLGAYGNRVFAFCDNLDIVNRLYRQYRDAEGLEWPGRRRSPRSLAAQRLPQPMGSIEGGPVDWPDRDRDGQQWWMSEQLGFDERELVIGRTSSQDAGVTTAADVVITTASLDVGFDDPQVGAVLQHKAPRDIAQFLQRRGRAGRTQVQRPWTVAVLSDFGRDRNAYQDYERLLDPELPEKRLPMGNQSVRKMQAAMCLLDWVAQRLGAGNRRLNVRELFIGPLDETRPQKPESLRQQQKYRQEVVLLLKNVIDGGSDREDLLNFVSRGLRLPSEEIASIAWEQPRSLLLDAVPTAYRRLASSWSQFRDGDAVAKLEPTVADSPLPEFIPKALFSDLCLPEVAIDPPEDYDDAAKTTLGVQQALSELAPGKVTLRWAVTDRRGLWIPPAPDGQAIELSIHLAHQGEIIDSVFTEDGNRDLVRPYITSPVIPDNDVEPSSNGRLHWQFHCEPHDHALALVRPRHSPLGDRISSVSAYLHAGRGALRTLRYAIEATATVTYSRRGRRRVRNTFTWNGGPAAVGYEASVDALVFDVKVPASLAEFFTRQDEGRLRQLRRDYFVDIFRRKAHEADLDPFVSQPLADAVVAAAAHHSRNGDDSIGAHHIQANQWRPLIQVVLGAGVVNLDEDDDYDDSQLSPRSAEILDTVDKPEVQHIIAESAPLLAAEPDDTWIPWLQARWAQTMAAAAQAAAQALCPDFDVEDDCVVDVMHTGDRVRFVISDAAVGGGGLIETLTQRISDDPRRFDYLITSALQPSDLEAVDGALRQTLELLDGHPAVARQAQVFRAAEDDRLNLWQELLMILASAGVYPTHATISALANRVFRPGSDEHADALLRLCLSRWTSLERGCGFALDHRTACNLLAAEPDVQVHILQTVQQLSVTTTPADAAERRRLCQSWLMGLLWPSAEARRSTSLIAANRFTLEPPQTERTLVLDSLPDIVPSIDVDNSEWLKQLSDTIAKSGRCRLISNSGNRSQLKAALHHLATQPIEVGWLLLHPSVEAVLLDNGTTSIDVSLEEAPQ